MMYQNTRVDNDYLWMTWNEMLYWMENDTTMTTYVHKNENAFVENFI